MTQITIQIVETRGASTSLRTATATLEDEPLVLDQSDRVARLTDATMLAEALFRAAQKTILCE